MLIFETRYLFTFASWIRDDELLFPLSLFICLTCNWRTLRLLLYLWLWEKMFSMILVDLWIYLNKTWSILIWCLCATITICKQPLLLCALHVLDLGCCSTPHINLFFLFLFWLCSINDTRFRLVKLYWLLDMLANALKYNAI